MPRHSPAPFRIAGQSEAGRYITVKAANGRTVARVPFSPQAEGEKGLAADHFDAHLFAAAPDMLTALRAVSRWLTPDRFNRNGLVFDTQIPAGALEAVLSALAKAEGGK